MEHEPDPILERIRVRLAATGKSERGAAEEAGLSAAAIRNIREGKSQSPRLDTIRKLAVVLETTPEWLAFGLSSGATLGGGVGSKPELASPPRGQASEITEINATFVELTYGGVVEAGSWRTVEDFDDFEHLAERPRMQHPPDREFPHLPQTFFDVAGDSMNALKPRPILAGDRVVTIAFAEFRGGLALRDGMVVVVEQTLDGGHHRERSVKQVELYDDRIEFHPRSNNKRHKPIIVPRTVFTDPSENDGREANVLAICRRITNELPM